MNYRTGRYALILLLIATSTIAQCAVAVAQAPGSPEPVPDIPVRLDEYPEETPDYASYSKVEELEARIAELEFALADQSARKPAPAPKVSDNVMPTRWGEQGFEGESKNKNFRTHVGGRVQVDGVLMGSDDLVLGGVGDADAVDFRRARLRVDGVMYKTMSWAAEFDFVNSVNEDPTATATPVTPFGGNVINVTAPTDLWFNFAEVPWVGNVRIGNQKEAIGLEHMQSSRFLDFMERSFLQDAFYGPFNNGFTPGVAIFDWNEDETVTYNIGVFKYTQNAFGYDTGEDQCAFTGRLTCVPWASDEDSFLVHVGLGASYRQYEEEVDPATGNVRIRSRASLRNGPGSLNPNLADTNFAGRIFTDNQFVLAPELAVVDGPWYWQAEYVSSFLNGATFTLSGGAPGEVGRIYYQGAYGQVLYFLTGEHREYERHEARFGRVHPHCNTTFRPNGYGICGPGAWQIGARYGFLDLNDLGVNGGYIQDLTIGLNWYINPFAKLQFDYILQHVDNTMRNSSGTIIAENDGELHGFGTRFAFDF